jgi:SepF-like predicted cell division protein (DUF552 family)
MRAGFPVLHHLEDRIRALSAQAVASSEDPDELEEVIGQLRAALHEHSQKLRKLAATNLIVKPRGMAAD